MATKTVLTTDLITDLKKLRASFLDWDNQRRLKVDIVIEALDTKQQTVDLERVLKAIDCLSQNNEYYRQLAPAAKKMLVLYYRELARNEDKVKSDNERNARAKLKIETFKKQGLL